MLQNESSGLQLTAYRAEEYLKLYTGKLQARRLECFAEKIPSVADDFMKRSQSILEEGLDENEYKQFIVRAQSHGYTNIIENEESIIKISERFRMQSEQLNLQLDTYKRNLQRDEILSTYLKLGSIHYEHGDYQTACQLYLESRAYAVGFNQQIQILLKLIQLSTYSRLAAVMERVDSFVQDLCLTPVDAPTKIFLSIYEACLGLHCFWNREYASAANHFLSCFPEMDNKWNEV